ncbi:MAG: hypothetical protein WEE51_06665, partial [Pirellulaceae bacterium]
MPCSKTVTQFFTTLRSPFTEPFGPLAKFRIVADAIRHLATARTTPITSIDRIRTRAISAGARTPLATGTVETIRTIQAIWAARTSTVAVTTPIR